MSRHTDSGDVIDGGALLAETLRVAGVSKAFTLHGGHLEALYKGCIEQGIDLIDFRHEAAAGHAADAYARATGELGVCIVTAGPGFANAIPAIVNAKLDGSPVLFIIGAPPIREAETNPLQGGIDQIAMARPAAKWALSVVSTERMQDLAAMAIRKALAPPYGPVVLEVPIDVLHMAVSRSRSTAPTGVTVRCTAGPTQGQIETFADLLKGARYPIVVAGLEAASVEAAAALRNFVEKVPLPVYHKTAAAGALPFAHPCNAGDVSNLAVLPLVAHPPDLVILLGARMGLFLAGRSGKFVPASARLIQIHSDPGEIGRIRDVDLAIAANPAETLDALREKLGDTLCGSFQAWNSQASAVRTAFASPYPEHQTDKGIHPWHAAVAVTDAVGPDAAYVFDGGEAAIWGSSAAKVNDPCRLFTHGYLGCLGIGPGFAIGAQIANPDRHIVHLTGDGAAAFHIQELDTMVRHRLPIINVVLNNQVWGMSLHGQQLMYGPNYHAITKLGGTNFADVAAAFGCYSERVYRYDDIAPAIERALDSALPALIEIMTDGDIVHPATVAMLGQLEEGSVDIMIPYYENIPGGVA